MNKTRAAMVVAMGVLSTATLAPTANAFPENGDVFSMCAPGYQLAINPPLCGAKEAVNVYGAITVRSHPINLFRATGWNKAKMEEIAQLPPCGGFYYEAPWQEYVGKCKPPVTTPSYAS